MNQQSSVHHRWLTRKRVWILIAIVLFICIVAVLAISVYVGWNLVKPEQKPLSHTPEEYNLAYEDITFQSRHDGITLSGWWIPSQESGEHVEKAAHTVVFAHGYRGNRLEEGIEILNLAQRLTSEGYNVLTFDFRQSGESEEALATIGLYEKDDLLSAVDFAQQTKNAEQVSVIGWSMGAVTSLLAAAESDDIAAVVADSPFSDLEEYLEVNLPHWSGLPDFPFTPIILNIIPLTFGLDVEEVSPYQVVEQWEDQPLLLIHSRADEAIPYTESERIYEAISNMEQVEMWLTNEGAHIQSYVTDQQEYEERVLQLLESVDTR